MPTGDAVTSPETRILLSFAMVEHGGQFAHWLRDKLMKKYNYYSTNSVYMDCVASRDTKHRMNTAKLVPKEQQRKGITYVTPDTRDQFKSQGYMPIGATNSQWNQKYLAAMKKAKTMILVVTPSYLASQWCLLELTQFHNQRKKSRIKGIAIRFTDGADVPLSVDMTDVTPLILTKASNVGGLLWHKDDYGLSEPDLQKLYDTIGDAH